MVLTAHNRAAIVQLEKFILALHSRAKDFTVLHLPVRVERYIPTLPTPVIIGDMPHTFLRVSSRLAYHLHAAGERTIALITPNIKFQLIGHIAHLPLLRRCHAAFAAELCRASRT